MDMKIVERIQKLLALSESSNKHESQSAMLKAQELLVKHKLSMREVTETKVHNSAIKDLKTAVTFTKAKWKGRLATIIGENFGCYVFFKTRGTNTITFFGREEDAAVCSIVLDYALDCISSSVKQLQREYIRDGLSTKGIENDFALGFIVGLREKFEEQKEAHQEWGLVLVKDPEVEDAYGEKKFKRSLSTHSRFSGHTAAYKQGSEEGYAFSIADKVAGGSSRPRGELTG